MKQLTQTEANVCLAEMVGIEDWTFSGKHVGDTPLELYEPTKRVEQAIECLEAWRKQDKDNRRYSIDVSHGDGDIYIELDNWVSSWIRVSYNKYCKDRISRAASEALVSAITGEQCEIKED